ncbi:hypothetical protein SPAN111604_06120 [Sphingomonas antarctica]|uniref:hypothetical protein n=1 Tax=Sphingomonas antarctica TaxID=2040274 RepID=UPI0039EB663C
MKVSVNEVWDDTLAFLRAERALVVPVALGTIYLASVIAISASLMLAPTVRGLPIILASAWGIIGQFALIDLVLKPQRSVREALGKGARTLPPAILVYVMIGALLMLLSLPLIFAIMQAGYTAENMPAVMADQVQMMKLAEALPSWASVYLLAFFAVCCFVFIRLILWKPAITIGGRPIDALKQSWALTHGRFWSLFGLVLLAGLVTQLVDWAITTAFGAVFLIVGRAIESAIVAQLVPALIAALVATAFQTVITVFVARYYQRATY